MNISLNALLICCYYLDECPALVTFAGGRSVHWITGDMTSQQQLIVK